MRLKKLHRPGGESFCTLLTHSQCTSEGTHLIVISNSHLIKDQKSQVFNYFNILALLNYSLGTLSTGNSYSWFTFQLVQRSKESWKSSKATLLQLVLQLWCASSGIRGNCLLSSRKSLHMRLTLIWGNFLSQEGLYFCSWVVPAVSTAMKLKTMTEEERGQTQRSRQVFHSCTVTLPCSQLSQGARDANMNPAQQC